MRPFALTPGLWMVADGLATFRLTRLVTTDTILDPVRSRVKRRALGVWDFLTCPWCVGMWIAAGVAALTVTVPDLWVYAAVTLSFSAIAGIISERT